MKYNHAPISLREGHIFLDGVEVSDGVKCEIKFTPDVWTGRQLGERTPSSRWLGYSISLTVTRRRATNWLQEKIAEYQKSGETPEFTVQGISDDKGSDFYKEHGTATVTCVGCVMTGDLPLSALDSEGNIVEDNISFNAKDVIF